MPPAAPASSTAGAKLKALAFAAGLKLLQIVVGTGFMAVLHTEWGIAVIQRMFHTPEALSRSKASRSGSVKLLETSQKADLSSGNATGAEKGGNGAGPIMIRAVASDPQSVKPIMLHNDPKQGHDSEAWRLVGPYMRLYGRNAIANSQLFNPEFIHFFVPGMGSLPYVVGDVYSRVVVSVIGDPLCDKSKWRTITEMFIKEFPTTYFYHASAEYAAVLHEMGYCINDVGAETTLQVQQWTYSGKTRTVRAAARSAREAGVRIRELKADELTDELRRKLQHEVSGDWLQQKAVADRELRVFVRNVDYDNIQLQDGVRIFIAEAYHPAHAPPAVVDQTIQGVPPNAKPPKPPRNKSGRSLASQASGGLSRSNSVLTTASSTSSLSGLASSLSGLMGQASLSTGLAGSETTLAAVSAAAAEQSAAAGANGSSSSPFASRSALSDAVLHEEPGDADAHKEPELIGFVLLDPLWEDNHEIGYVSSICRMKRSAHQGTLKLLYEDIISKLRSEGKRELAFGFAPFFNVRDDRFSRIAYWIRWTNLYLFHCANNLYAFQNLAFSKIRYGAGVDGDKFKDPNVSMTHIYMACKSPVPGMEILDLYVLCMYVGFMGQMVDTWLKLVGLKRGGANLMSGLPDN